MRSRTLAVLGVVALLVLAGCGGSGGGSEAPAVSGGDGGAADAGSGGGDAGDGASRQASASSSAASTSAAAATTERIRIRSGQLSLTVEDYDRARTDLASLARERGGYVSDSSVQTRARGNATWQTGTLVLRVPSEDFSSTFERAKRQGTVESASTSTKDVTDKLLDLDARLRNLRAQRDRLRTLYEAANETEDVLRISEKLSEVQGEIERLEAEKRSLQQRVTYSTITVELREEPPEREPTPAPTQWYEVGVLDAFLDSVSGAVTALRALVVLAAYVLPYALLFGSPFVVGGVLLYRRYGRRSG